EVLYAAAALPGTHCAPQAVGLAGGKAGCNDSELHHLLLEDGDAESSLEYCGDLGAGIVNRLIVRSPAQVRMDHVTLDGSGAYNGNLDNEVVITLRFQARQHRHLCARLDLEHPDSVGAGHHPVNSLIFVGKMPKRVLRPS